jgi:hypothetical protein
MRIEKNALYTSRMMTVDPATDVIAKMKKLAKSQKN